MRLAWIVVQGAGAEQTARGVGLQSRSGSGRAHRLLCRRASNFPWATGSCASPIPAASRFNVFTSMFLHGGWMHLLGNMWFLWLFGNNIEDSMTRPRFLVFYLLCGVWRGAGCRLAANPHSAMPMVGASGAISGVMGAYLVLFPHVRVFTLIPLGFYVTTVALPAWAMLIYWTRPASSSEASAAVRRRGRRRGVLGAPGWPRGRYRFNQTVRAARQGGRTHVAALAAPARRLELTPIRKQEIRRLGGKEV